MARVFHVLCALVGVFLVLGLGSCRQRSYNATAMGSEREVEGFEILTDSGLADTVNSLSLLAHLGRLKSQYELAFPPVDALVKVEIINEKCEQSGFDFATGVLRFCQQDGVRALGTASEDVLAREVFAALFCKTYPVVCSSMSFQGVRTKEFVLGAGEFFAYQQKPDAYFGENFLSQKAFIYRYGEQGEGCVGESTDSLPFVSVMINKKYTLARLRQDVEAPLFWASRWLSDHKVCLAKSVGPL